MRRWILGAMGVLWLTAPAAAHAAPVSGVAQDIPSHRYAAHVASQEANLPYGGGPVLHANRTHVIFWQPSGSDLSFDPGYERLIETFLTNVAAASHDPTNVYGLTGQYTDGFGPAAYASTWGGAVIDTDRLPANGCVEPPVTGPPGWTVCLTNKQLQGEIEHVARTDHLPTGEDDIYFLVTPKGLGSCTDSSSTSCALGGSVSGYCGYHSGTPDGLVLYAVIPYNAVSGHCQSDNPRPNSNPADPTISTMSHEHSEMITDPVGDAWIDGSGMENGDRCITVFGPPIGGSGDTAWNEDIGGGHYYLQEEWSNEDRGCQPRDESDQVSVALPRTAVAGRTLQLVGRGRDPDGSIVSYFWQFGDGSRGHGRTVHHRYRRAGMFQITLRITDSVSNWTFYTRAISVARARRRSRRGA